jgi:flagellar biosynthesis/type III secretory pathway protein FliH
MNYEAKIFIENVLDMLDFEPSEEIKNKVLQEASDFYTVSSMVGYDTGYEDGQNEMYDDGYSDGYNDGYDAGYREGEAEGESEGFSRGFREGNDYY